MKMVPTSRTLNQALAMRRVTPSPASTTYRVSLTISKFEHCARWARGGGPATVPSVIRRVSTLDGGVLICATLCAPRHRQEIGRSLIPERTKPFAFVLPHAFALQ